MAGTVREVQGEQGEQVAERQPLLQLAQVQEAQRVQEARRVLAASTVSQAMLLRIGLPAGISVFSLDTPPPLFSLPLPPSRAASSVPRVPPAISSFSLHAGAALLLLDLPRVLREVQALVAPPVLPGVRAAQEKI
jgi:hypothetical protein